MPEMTDERQREIEKLNPKSTYAELSDAIVELFNERTRLTKELAAEKKLSADRLVAFDNANTQRKKMEDYAVEQERKYLTHTAGLDADIKKQREVTITAIKALKTATDESDDLRAELNDLKPALSAKTILLDNIRKRLAEGNCDACRRLREDMKWATEAVKQASCTHEWHNISSHGAGDLEQICIKCSLRRTHNPKEVRNCGNCGDGKCKKEKQPPDDHVCPVWCPNPDDDKPKGVKYVTEPEDPPKKKSGVPKKLKCTVCGLVIETLTDVDNIKLCEKCHAQWSYAPVKDEPCPMKTGKNCPRVPPFRCEDCDFKEDNPFKPNHPDLSDFQSPYEMGEGEDPSSIENVARMAMSCARCAGCQQYTCPVPNAVNQTNPRKKKG